VILESNFQKKVIDEIQAMYPGAVILKNDPNYIQGIPDWLILNNKRWAALEIKRSPRSGIQPNQPYWVDVLDAMSFARFLTPENKEDILHELRKAL